MKIIMYCRFSNNTFKPTITYAMDSPHFKFINGRLYSVFDKGKSGTPEHCIKLSGLCMSEEEAIDYMCGCYYKIEDTL